MFQDRAACSASRRCCERADDKERRRLRVQLGTSRALDDVQALRGILDSRDDLAMLGAQLPGHINSLAGPVLESVKAQLDSPVAAKSDLFLYSLVLVMSKLASPWQLIRLATKAAGSDDAKRIAETPYAVAVDDRARRGRPAGPRARRRSQERPRHRGGGPAQGGP